MKPMGKQLTSIYILLLSYLSTATERLFFSAITLQRIKLSFKKSFFFIYRETYNKLCSARLKLQLIIIEQ